MRGMRRASGSSQVPIEPLSLPILAALTLCLAVSAPVLGEGDIRPAGDAPRPSPPEKSRQLFKLSPGFRIDIVASEPLLADPTGVAWDARGRLFVCELHGYNLEGHLDVVELNRSGVLDRQVRRIPARPAAREAAMKETYGTVKRLEDRDGDGRMDRAHVWADRLPPCYGILAARGGLIVTCAPDIVYLADRDGDDRAEVRKTLFTGFEVGALERGINSPIWGLDNWIYVAAGRGGRIEGPRLSRPVDLGRSDFRFRSDGSAIEPVTGSNGTFGLTMTDFGDRFVLDTSNHARYAVPLAHRYLARNPYAPSPPTVANAADYTRIYPISEPHPWRLARSRDPDWVRFYGQHEATASGHFTSACGQLIYRADALPPEYRGNHFACDPQNNIVHRSILEREGAGYRVRRAPGEEEREFLASSEKWFRPIRLVVGPDGAMYIVDMYREVIEDYSAIPRFLQQQYGLVRGSDRGRLWRLAHQGAGSARRVRLDEASIEDLVALTGDTDAWWRENAQRLLVERGDPSAVPLLRSRVEGGESAASRLHAMYTLEGLGALRPGDLLSAVRDPSPGVRVHALRLADRWLDESEELLHGVLARVGDADAGVRLQIAMSLGESTDPRALEALAHLGAEHGDERWMVAAITSSCAESAHRLLDRLLRRAGGVGRGAALIGSLSATVGARRSDGEIGQVLVTLARIEAEGGTEVAALGLAGLSGGLRRESAEGLRSEPGRQALFSLLASSEAAVRRRAFEVLGALRLQSTDELRVLFRRAARDAVNDRLPVETRLGALELLANAPFAELRPAAEVLLAPRHPPRLQLAAVAALGGADDPGVASLLLGGWASHSPAMRAAVLEVVFAHTTRLDALLDSIERGEVPAAAVSRFHRLQLTESDEPSRRARARRIFENTGSTPEQESLFEPYVAVLSHRADPRQGEALFREQCQKCHVANGSGHAVGPDLVSERERADETLLRDILTPSAQIAEGYPAYLAITKDGRAMSGVLVSESATSVTLRQAEGVEETVLRRNLRSFTASSVSLMPENFQELLSPHNVIDIIAFLRETFGEQRPVAVTLFDDDSAFVKLLDTGSGTASLATEDVHSGKVALVITPPQRYSHRIPGWSFPIVERPGPGEFRYLRLAWKTRGADGVMLELAADGGWPAPGDPVRRYYSGKNTTVWQARRVSPRSPGEWTVVTLDLWKDNGAFTLTGMAPTAMGGKAFFDRIELLRSLAEVVPRPE